MNQERISLAYVSHGLAEQFTLSRDFTSGFTQDRDFRNLSLASTTAFRRTDVVLAYNDRPFGADQFYGNYNSWERTKTWFASLSQGLGEKTTAAFAYRRHSDLFVLYRDRPQVFTNRHIDESYQGSLRRREDLGTNLRLHYGVEGYHDSVDSNNLGSHRRARGSGYAALDVRAMKRFSFTIGAREEVYGHKQRQFSPSVGAGYWLSPQWKLRASASRAFRLPSYTDLYYHDPANLGSANLRPEHAASYEGGIEWRARRLRAEATVFSRRERDGIDYVRNSPADIWRATNFQRLNFTGVETAFGWDLDRANTLDFRYTGLKGAQAFLGTSQSKYSFNYPTHSGLIAWHARLPREFALRTRIGVLQRLGRDPYAVWDAYAAWSKYRVRPYLQLTNIADTVYQEIFGVRVPGRAAVVGLEWMLYRGRKQ